MHARHLTLVLAAAALAFGAGCGGDKKTTCDPTAQNACTAPQVCEAVEGATTHTCFDPVVVKGKVFDLSTTSKTGVGGGKVVVLDPNRAPLSAVATAASDGTYEAVLPTTRTANGTPASQQVTLRADAKGFQSFPSALRAALPFDVTTATHANGKWTVQSQLTDVGLLPLAPGSGTASVHGKADVPTSKAGVMVIAETGSGASAVGVTGFADRSGNYTIFNLAAGTWTVKAFSPGVNYTPSDPVTLAATDDKAVDLHIANQTTATVTGSVDITGQNLPASPSTSVILVVESTFNASADRGEAPPGLRAANVTGAWSIDGVPDGSYIALAAFENDGMVRDVSGIGGTAPVVVTVASGAMTSAAAAFKVTGAISLLAPYDDGTDGTTIPSANPTTAVTPPTTSQPFTWTAYPSADHYEATVVDAFGSPLWTDANVPGTSGNDVSVTYPTTGVPALEQGKYYQFRAIAKDTNGRQISQTEDLRGVFIFQP